MNVNQIDYNKTINKSILCIACTSKHEYRLGKYVEIPMAGSVIVGDLPYEDKQSFSKFVIEVNMKMSDFEILSKIEKYLENKEEIEKMKKIGLKWAKQYNTKNYVDKLIKTLYKDKIYIISDEIRDNHPEFKNEKWICDILKKEFMDEFPEYTTLNAKEANIIWYLAPLGIIDIFLEDLSPNSGMNIY